jgi:hypothetical protein
MAGTAASSPEFIGLSATVHQKRNRGHGEQEGANASSPRAESHARRAWGGPTTRNSGR